MKDRIKRSVFFGMGGFAAVIAAALLISGSNRSVGFFFLAFTASFLVLNFLFAIPAAKLKSRAGKAAAAGLIAAVNLILALSGSVYYLQEKLIFYPNNSVDCFQEISTDDSFQEVKLTAKDGTQLSGWLRLSASGSRAPLIFYFGGNGQNSSRTFSNFRKKGIFAVFEGYNVMAVDYRGYGYSEGKADDQNMFSDALDIYDFAVKQPYTDPARVVPLGYSIGTGEAVYLASQRPTAGLILVAPYYSGLRLCNDSVDIFHGPLTHLVRYSFDSERYAPQVSYRPLIFTSKTDEAISWQQSEALAKRFSSADLKFIDGATHETYFQNSKVTDAMWEYLTKIRGTAE
jgi:predicted acyl esterase